MVFHLNDYRASMLQMEKRGTDTAFPYVAFHQLANRGTVIYSI